MNFLTFTLLLSLGPLVSSTPSPTQTHAPTATSPPTSPPTPRPTPSCDAEVSNLSDCVSDGIADGTCLPAVTDLGGCLIGESLNTNYLRGFEHSVCATLRTSMYNSNSSISCELLTLVANVRLQLEHTLHAATSPQTTTFGIPRAKLVSFSVLTLITVASGHSAVAQPLRRLRVRLLK